jgi:hypothetical protein
MYDTRNKFTDMEDWINQARQAEVDAYMDFGVKVDFGYHDGETWVYLYSQYQGPQKFDTIEDAIRWTWKELGE